MRGFFGFGELVGFKGFQRFMLPVKFVVFAEFEEFMKFECLGLVELVGSKDFSGV